MKKLFVSSLCLCAGIFVLSGITAFAEMQRYRFRTDGASATVMTYGPSGTLYLSVSETDIKGQGASNATFLSFSTGTGSYPDLVTIYGDGYIPASAVRVSGTSIQVTIDDLTSLEGYQVIGFRCVQGNCDFFSPGPVPVDITISETGAYKVHSTGTTQLHYEQFYPPGVTVDRLQTGVVSYSSAIAEGRVAETILPFEDQVLLDGSISHNKGLFVEVYRSEP